MHADIQPFFYSHRLYQYLKWGYAEVQVVLEKMEYENIFNIAQNAHTCRHVTNGLNKHNHTKPSRGGLIIMTMNKETLTNVCELNSLLFKQIILTSTTVTELKTTSYFFFIFNDWTGLILQSKYC